MIKALFTSDLHGVADNYDFLFEKIQQELPEAVFIGGDLVGKSNFSAGLDVNDFLKKYLTDNLQLLKNDLKDKYPKIFVILGNDDPLSLVDEMENLTERGLINYVQQKKYLFRNFQIVGYSFVPPTPFLNKDWEKYDVSRFTDVGAVSPEEGYRSKPVNTTHLRFYTIKHDLKELFSGEDLSHTICLFHSPPYHTDLDRADLVGKSIDHVPLDIHVGSIAIKDFILLKAPYITLHGHIHESTRLTGKWRQKIGKTNSFQAASEHGECRIILLDLDDPSHAKLLSK
ncbi:MAG: hypothetical protein K9N07_05250 [Candidatus Cloacimonetes bacterium]|nr:hypothetical protein [Candidatus Cloacimonadota bacterium]